MDFRPSDEELFEDNPEEYIRRDIEGSDVDTRRRAACDLVKALSKSFEVQMTEIFGRYVAVMLESYAQSPEKNWRSKDSAVYLIIALASKGQTARHGTTQTNQLVDLVDFFRTHIVPEIQQPNVDRLMVLKADAIKYLMTFRNHLPREAVVVSLKPLVDLLRSPSLVVHSYAANAIDKLLILKGADGSALIKATDLSGMEQALLVNLFHAMTLAGSEENEYIMKAIMRTFSSLQEAVLPYLGQTLVGLNHKLMLVSRNPSKPHFNHYLFETLSLSVRIGCKADRSAVASFEDGFFPSFQEILLQDVQEFVPYVFQILSLMLELRGGQSEVPESYMALFPHLLVPVLWERPANIHPLVRLLQAFIQIGSRQVVASQKLEALLGIFQKLVASKSNDHEGFYLLQSMIEYLPKEALTPFLSKLFVLLFQRLSSSKTTKYVKSTIVFFSLFAIRYSPSELIAVIDAVQPKLFAMVIERLIVPEVQRVSGTLERKICAVGLGRLLCDSPECFTGTLPLIMYIYIDC
jgi:exportin-2 (importin alpha re-exporter)